VRIVRFVVILNACLNADKGYAYLRKSKHPVSVKSPKHKTE